MEQGEGRKGEGSEGEWEEREGVWWEKDGQRRSCEMEQAEEGRGADGGKSGELTVSSDKIKVIKSWVQRRPLGSSTDGCAS